MNATAGLGISAILLTHTHFDHVMTVPELVTELRSSVYAHQAETQVWRHEVDHLLVHGYFDADTATAELLAAGRSSCPPPGRCGMEPPAHRAGTRHGEGDALNNLGLALRQVRRFEEAIGACQAAAIYRETGDRHREGDALNNLGLALRQVGQFEEAITAHQEAVVICRETGDEHDERIALDNLETTRAAQEA